jgi:threonine dehydrogenase-like Zn-dependent dehydrogenase
MPCLKRTATDEQSVRARDEEGMKGLVYNGPRDVSVKDVPDARIQKSTDVLVRITIINIRGSDLHMYEGRTDMEQAVAA